MSRAAPDETWELCLYVAGGAPRSAAARRNVELLCDRHLAGRYRLEVVDLLADPDRAREDQVLAVPTLVRRSPRPTRRVVGDLSDPAHALSALDLPAIPERPREPSR
ncbi:MAG TPA: circadian clock KaiB family protein [Thermoanaerobaculia bacterium]